MRTDAERIAKYVTKVTPANVALIVTAALTDMKANFASATGDLVAKEIEIQSWANAAAIPTCKYPFYLAFGRELYKLQTKGISGGALTAAAQSVKDKWEAHGLTSLMLIAEAADVFALTLT